MRALLIAVSIAWTASAFAAGSYRVGFEVIDGTPKVSVWYPARADGASLRFGDYYGDRRASEGEFLEHVGLSKKAIASLFALPMHARRGATPLRTRFPLILIAQGNGDDASDQAFLAEVLAGHGYIVASTPSPMLATPMKSEDEVGAFAQRQATDLANAIPVVTARFRVAAKPIAVVGHSFGARAALLLAMKRPDVNTLVSLDGGIGTSTGIESLKAAPDYSIAHVPAILHLYERQDSFMTPDFRFLESLHAPVLREVEIASVHHIHFTSIGFAAAKIPELRKLTKGGADIDASVARIARLTLEFIGR